MRRVIVEVDLDGICTVDAQGFEGEGCKEATEPVARALGRITETKVKPEALLKSASRLSQKAGG